MNNFFLLWDFWGVLLCMVGLRIIRWMECGMASTFEHFQNCVTSGFGLDILSPANSLGI